MKGWCAINRCRVPMTSESTTTTTTDGTYRVTSRSSSLNTATGGFAATVDINNESMSEYIHHLEQLQAKLGQSEALLILFLSFKISSYRRSTLPTIYLVSLYSLYLVIFIYLCCLYLVMFIFLCSVSINRCCHK